MKIHRIFPANKTQFLYVESTGISEDLRDDLILGKVSNQSLDFNLSIKNKSKKYPDFTGVGTSEFFVNKKFKEKIEEYIAPSKVKFINVKVVDQDYWLLNILQIKDVINRERSEIEYYDNGEIDEIYNLQINQQDIDKYDIFRLKEYPVPIFITDDLKNVFQDSNFTGITYFSSCDLSEFE